MDTLRIDTTLSASGLTNSIGSTKPTSPTRPEPSQASKNRRDFEQVLKTQAEAPGSLVDLAQNASVKPLLAANGGYGLEAFLNSSGMLQSDGDLASIVARLTELTGGGGLGSAESCSHMGREDLLFPRNVSASQALGQASGQASGRASGLASEPLSSLSARYESGALGSAAIGYDETGGTSYGLYQIASKTGTFDNFLGYLDKRAPDLARRLRQAQPANTGSRDGRMPEVWRSIAASEPKRFADLQRDFINESHFRPALDAIREQTGVDVSGHGPALKEVLWSTAVQHGPSGASRIFTTALDKAQGLTGRQFDAAVIDNVYAKRATQFSSSTPRVQAAVTGRFQEEHALARLMLERQMA